MELLKDNIIYNVNDDRGKKKKHLVVTFRLLFNSILFPPFVIIGRPRPATPYTGNVQAARGTYVGNFGYQQQPLSYSYQGLMYPPYG